MNKIDKVFTLTLGTEAETVLVQGLNCLVQNNSGSAAVFFKEKRSDGVDVTPLTGWRLGPGEVTRVPMTALELSLIAESADTDVRVLLLDEY